MNFAYYIGIDQTGAVDKNGIPKPFNVSIIDSRNNKSIFYTMLKLKSISRIEIETLLKKTVQNYQNEKSMICIDCVFGLPYETETSINQILKKAKSFKYKNKDFGALTAYQFFKQFLKKNKNPRRIVEEIANANSVFNLTPYQKNIGCGSYRILKELSSDKKWFCLWPFNLKTIHKHKFVLAEGYPSYFWKMLFNSRTRDIQLLKKRFNNLKIETVDHADSFILALGAKECSKQITQPVNKLKKEGWILGVPYE